MNQERRFLGLATPIFRGKICATPVQSYQPYLNTSPTYLPPPYLCAFRYCRRPKAENCCALFSPAACLKNLNWSPRSTACAGLACNLYLCIHVFVLVFMHACICNLSMHTCICILFFENMYFYPFLHTCFLQDIFHLVSRIQFG